VLLLFVTSMVKPPGCRSQSTAQKGEDKNAILSQESEVCTWGPPLFT